MTLAELRTRLETRALEADAMRATAPLGDTLRFVLAELATVNGNGTAKALPAPTRLLTARDAAPLLGVSVRWLYRHAGTLPFARRLSDRAVRFEEAGLLTWLERRR